MPVGLVNDDQFLSELSKYEKKSVEKTRTPTQSVQIVEKPSRGRDEGDVNVPDPLRQIIGEEAVINGRQSALGIARMFGISDSSVSAYAKGATSTTTYHEPKSSIINHLQKSRQRASKKAGVVLTRALGAITQDKLDYTDAKDLSVIAKNMSAIIRDLEPPSTQSSNGDTSNQSPQFVIFAPQFRQENSFEHITVQE